MEAHALNAHTPSFFIKIYVSAEPSVPSLEIPDPILIQVRITTQLITQQQTLQKRLSFPMELKLLQLTMLMAATKFRSMPLVDASKPSHNAQSTNQMGFANTAPTDTWSPSLEIALPPTAFSSAKMDFGKIQ